MTVIAPGVPMDDPGKGGLCLVDGSGHAVLADAAATRGFAVVSVPLDTVRDRGALFDALADALRFPATFGHNWDALADSLGDLSWLPAPGYLIRLEACGGLRDAAPGDFGILLEILEQAAHSHRRAGVPFWALLGGTDTNPE